MQPRVNGLAIDDHVFVAAQRGCEFRMLRLDQERALVLVAWVQQLQIESLVDPVRPGDRPRAPVSGAGLVEPAVRRLVPVHSRLIPGPCGQPVRSAAARGRTPARLTAPATVWRPTAASRTHRTIVPAPAERVTRKSATQPGCTSLRPRSPTVSARIGHEPPYERMSARCLSGRWLSRSGYSVRPAPRLGSASRGITQDPGALG